MVDLRFQIDEVGHHTLASEPNNHVTGEEPFIDKGSRDRARSPAKGIPHHRIPTFGGNNHAHPNMFGWASINDEVRGDSLVSAPNHLAKVAGLNDAVVAGEHRGWLDRDFAATLAAASGEDGATGTSAHAQTETVNFRTAAVVGLVGTLRHFFSSASGRHSQGE
jgi:hypothetical protein